MIILYDGVCALCNFWVKFILKRDGRNLFRFAALQSGFSRKILARHGRNPDRLDTVIVVQNFDLPSETILDRSRAAFFVIKTLGGFWRWLGIFSLLPAFVTDFFYNFVARTRYRVFGKYETCPLPDEKVRGRFMEI